ncbi:MAG: hypothetical protein IPM78_09685 [Moraxellaceae bacterium]|nr:hypothetical protein [Moraxellaceae bacterium]
MTGKKALPANFFVRQMTVSVKRMLLMTLLFCGAFMIQPSSSYRIDKVTERGTLRVIGVAGPTTFLPHGAEAHAVYNTNCCVNLLKNYTLS